MIKLMPSDQKGIAHLLLLILLVVGIGLGVYLVQNRTNIFPHAASGPANPRTAFSFQAANNSVQVGSTINIGITASSDLDAANTFVAKVVYKSNILEPVVIKPDINEASGSFITKWVEQSILPPDADGYGAVLLSGVVPNPGYKTQTGKPELMATITFKAIAPGTTNLGFTLNESAIYRNSDNQNILTATDGMSVIVNPPGSAIPTVDTDKDGFLDGDELFFGTDPIKACGANAWPPDVNDDTFVNGTDVSFMVPYTDGSKPYSKRYDFDRNGQITQDDVTVIQKYFLQSCGSPTGSASPAACSTIALSKTSAISTPSSVVWTYTYPNSTRITSVNFPAKAGLSYSMNGQSGASGQGLNVNLGSGSSQIIFKITTEQACSPFTASFTMTNNCGTQMPDFVGIGSAGGWGAVCNPGPQPSSSPTASATPLPVVDGKRADLYKDTKKPGFVNDQDVSVFFTKCAEKGIELFGQPAAIQPVCDIFQDGKITVQDWAVLLKFRNQQT